MNTVGVYLAPNKSLVPNWADTQKSVLSPLPDSKSHPLEKERGWGWRLHCTLRNTVANLRACNEPIYAELIGCRWQCQGGGWGAAAATKTEEGKGGGRKAHNTKCSAQLVQEKNSYCQLLLK
jgi:hypothetical protein